MRLALTTFVLAAVSTVAAQQPGGVQDQAKAVVKKIQSEMEQIDKLLDQATRDAASKAEIKKTLKSSLDSNKVVLDEIQKLLDLAQQQSQRQQQQQRPGNRPQGRRRQNQPKPDDRRQTPEVVNQQQDTNQPRSNKPDRKDGQNIKNRVPIDPKTGKPKSDKEAGEWGNLPEYLRAVFKKGGMPRTPGRYSRFVEEFFKSVDKKKKKGR